MQNRDKNDLLTFLAFAVSLFLAHKGGFISTPWLALGFLGLVGIFISILRLDYYRGAAVALYLTLLIVSLDVSKILASFQQTITAVKAVNLDWWVAPFVIILSLLGTMVQVAGKDAEVSKMLRGLVEITLAVSLFYWLKWGDGTGTQPNGIATIIRAVTDLAPEDRPWAMVVIFAAFGLFVYGFNKEAAAVVGRNVGILLIVVGIFWLAVYKKNDTITLVTDFLKALFDFGKEVAKTWQ